MQRWYGGRERDKGQRRDGVATGIKERERDRGATGIRERDEEGQRSYRDRRERRGGTGATGIRERDEEGQRRAGGRREDVRRTYGGRTQEEQRRN
jgi:hypothetical protein